MKRFTILLLSAAVLAFGCSPLEGGPGPETLLSVTLPEVAPATRSVLPATAAFENTVNEVTFISYNASSGLLEGAVYVSGTSATLSLDSHATHHVYCLANMGDYSAAAPSNETALRNLYYTIPSFSGMATTGMPMAGMSESSGSGPVTVSVRRLLSKVVITVDRSDVFDWNSFEPFYFNNLRVENVARRLYPFAVGGSRARSADDFFASSPEGEDLTDVDYWDSDTGERVLYIPENCQGTLLEGNNAVMDKSLSNPALSEQESAALCTYISFEGDKETSDGVGGTLIYRFFPGGDATRNFSLQGGKLYTIVLSLTWNGMFTQGNWMVTRSNWNDTRIIQVSLKEDDDYASNLSFSLPVGITDYPVYVYYNPWGDPFDYDYADHYEGPFGFGIGGYETDNTWGYVEDEDGVYAYYDEGLGFCSTFLVSIPSDNSLIGTTKLLRFFTREKLHIASCNISLVQPTILIDQSEVIKGPGEYGTSGQFTVRVIGGSVPKNEINVSSSSSDLRVVLYQQSTGIATVCWQTANNAATPKSATLTFSGLGASAVCTVYQSGRSAFDIGGDDDGGEGDNNY